MQRVLLLASLLLWPLVASAEATSADLKRCPNGHASLKDVPILYGLPTMNPKEITRRVQNLEFVLGGCDVFPGDSTVLPTCTTCRFRFDSRDGTWSRTSSDIRTFRHPFTRRTTSFPVLARPRSLDYKQSLRRGRVVSEEVVYTASRDHPELRAQMDRWFAAHRIRARYSEPKEPRLVRHWEAPGISIRFSYEPGALFVWMTHNLRRKI